VVGGSTRQIFGAMLFGPWASMFGERKIGAMGVAKVSLDSLATLHQLLSAGKIVPVIDRSYPLAETARRSNTLWKNTPGGR